MALFVGDYDASTFVDGSYGTYPPLPAGVETYQPTMVWRVSVAGTVQGQAVAVDDLLFATQGAGRLYGDGTYGSQIFGGLSDGYWTVEQVFFRRWDASLPPSLQPPYPNAGCAFTRDDTPGGNWAPGWRIVVDAYFDDRVDTRRYGDDTYGDGTFGSEVEPLGGIRWVDLTQPSFRVETGDGMVDGTPRVTVGEIVVTVLDEAGVWFDVSEPATWTQPQPGTALRVGLIDPDYAYHPVITAEIERIEDVHDDQHPRTVMVRGFGRITDLVVDEVGWQRPAELASARFNALVLAAGWRWDPGSVVFPSDDAALIGDTSPRDINVRDELDRTCMSVGWFLDSDRYGRMRLRRWPHEATGTPIDIVDCAVVAGSIEYVAGELEEDPADSLLVLVDGTTEDPGGSGLYDVSEPLLEDPAGFDLYAPIVTDYVPAPTGLVSHSIVFANDQAQLLNRVVTSNTASPTPATATRDHELSQGLYGKRGRAYGFPMTGLAWADTSTARYWAQRVIDRFAYITRRIEMFQADTLIDPGWLAALAELDTGQALHFARTGIAALEMDGIAVGWRHTLEPGRWQSTVFVSTTTESN